MNNNNTNCNKKEGGLPLILLNVFCAIVMAAGLVYELFDV